MKVKSSRALKHKDYLSLLSKTKNVKRRRMLIDLADSDQVKAVAECVLNVLNGKVKLKSGEKKRLKKHKNVLRSIADKSNSVAKKKHILQQKGGFLPTLLPLAISALGSIVPALFGGK